METISQSHENSTATLRPPHGLSPVKTLEAESVHEVVGGRGATLDVHFRGVELVQAAADLLAACLPERHLIASLIAI